MTESRNTCDSSSGFGYLFSWITTSSAAILMSMQKAHTYLQYDWSNHSFWVNQTLISRPDFWMGGHWPFFIL